MIEPGLLAQRALYAGLDALRSVLLSDLAACVHVVDGHAPQLYLRQPALTSLSSQDALHLYGELQQLLHDENLPRLLTIGGRSACASMTRGGVARTLWVLGRHEPAFDAGEAEVVWALADAVGAVIATLDDVRIDLRDDALRVNVEGTASASRAEVWVPAGGGMRASRSEAATALIAIAQATLAAVNDDLKLATAAEDTIGGERAVLVMARDGLGRPAVGAAMCGADPFLATARAALDAARALSGSA